MRLSCEQIAKGENWGGYSLETDFTLKLWFIVSCRWRRFLTRNPGGTKMLLWVNRRLSGKGRSSEKQVSIDTCASLFVCPGSSSSVTVWWNSWQLGLAVRRCSVNQQFISSRFVQKVIVSSRSSLSTYSFLSEPSRQPLLNHGSPLWQRARTAAFTLTSNQISVWSIMGLLPSGQLWICKNNPLWYPLTAHVLEWCVCLCECVCIA